MESVSKEALDQAIRLLGNPKLSQDEAEERLRASKVEDMVARRLCSFIPEAFGMVAALHMDQKPMFLTTFSAIDEKGEVEEIPFSSEPIFEMAKGRAQLMYREWSRETFDTIANRSSIMEVIHEAVESAETYDGATMTIETGVPAEVYRKKAGSFWWWLMGPLWTKETE